MDHGNKINRLMIDRGLTNKEAAREISKAYKVEVSEDNFISAKLGYLRSKKIRAMISDFFKIPQTDIPIKLREKV